MNYVAVFSEVDIVSIILLIYLLVRMKRNYSIHEEAKTLSLMAYSIILLACTDIMAKMDKSIASLTAARKSVIAKRSTLTAQRTKMTEAISGIEDGRASARETLRQMKVLKAAVPGAFKTAEKDYLAKIDSKSSQLKKTFQDALNVGFRQIYGMSRLIRSGRKRERALTDYSGRYSDVRKIIEI